MKNLKAYTISTHNGSTVARDHKTRNRRITDKEGHIDPNGIYEVWHDERPQDAYSRLFGAAVQRYNAKQKRPDRQITNYYRDVCKDAKKHLVYEMIIAVGNTGSAPEPKQAKVVMKDFVKEWKKRNPNLELIGAYYHADEKGVPHVHIDYVPVAHGYRRGMDTQSALVKALGEQGFYKHGRDTAQILWQQSENQHLEQLCNEHGIAVYHPEQKHRQHAETVKYQLNRDIKRLQKTEAKIQEGIDRRKQQIERLTRERNELARKVADLQSTVSQICYDSTAFNNLQARYDRLYDLCKQYRTRDGKTVADKFKEAERARYEKIPECEITER